MSRNARDLHEAAWPDMFENLQTAYAELTRAQFELQQRSTEIDAARELFQRVIQSMSEGLFLLDTNGRIMQVNSSAAQLLNQDEAALVGQTLDACCGVSGVPYTPWQLLEQSPDGALRDLDVELRPHSAAPVTVSISCGLVRDHRGKITGVLAVFRDITERKRAEDALRFLAGASQVLVASLDLSTVLTNLARLAVPTLGDWCSIDLLADDGRLEPVGAAHIDPAKEPLIHELRTRFPLAEDAPVGYAYVLRTRRPVMVSHFTDEHRARVALGPDHARIIEALGVRSHICVPLIARGRTIGAITLNRAGHQHYTEADLTLAQDFAGRAAVAVDNARLYRDAQDANRMKDEFLSTLSHELRTPLNAILGWTRLLRLSKSDVGKLDRALEVIERNARAQQQLIEDLLDLSGIVAGKVRFDPVPVDLARVIETAVDGLRLAADAKGVAIVLDLETTTERVPGNPDRLQQVVWNLVSNAIKFTRTGGTVTVTARQLEGRLEVSVLDTGKGIRPEFLPHVFDRFRQEDASTTRAYGGLGLGLSIVKNLVEIHGGTVFAESAGEGRGARFVVSLPVLRTMPVAASTRPETALPPEGPSPLRGRRVLVVDDQEDTREMVAILLERWGATATLASTAAEAFERIVADPPDVLVSDVGLPYEDGYTLVRRVRELPLAPGRALPAVALTAYARDEDRRRALAMGFQAYVAKPFEPAELHAAICAALDDASRPP